LIDEQRFLLPDPSAVVHGSVLGVGKREQILFEPLVANLAGEEEVRPRVGKPEIARPAERVVLFLLEPSLGPKMLNVSETDGCHVRLAKRAFVILRLSERKLDGARGIDVAVKVIKTPISTGVILWCGVMGRT
jgi:hypothetical protein